MPIKILPGSIKSLLRRKNFAKYLTGVGIALFAAVGAILLFATKAATPFVSLEPESGNLSRTDLAVIDASASAGKAVKFSPNSPAPISADICTGRDANGGVPADKFPGAACTGVLPGVSRTSSGSITTTGNGQIIQNLNINGSIQVNHSNVLIKNVKITQPGGAAISINGPSGLVIEDCELDGTGNPSALSAIAEHNYTMRRCNVHHFGEGPRINGNVTLEDNYIHDFVSYYTGSPSDSHQDTIQITSGSNIIIRHNTLLMNVDGANGGLYTCCFGGNSLLIERNLLAGGIYATTGGGDINGAPLYSNTTIRDNRFSTIFFPNSGYISPLAYTTHDNKSGNVWHDDYGTSHSPSNRTYQYPNGDGPRKGQPI